jgi:hypothetical protein
MDYLPILLIPIVFILFVLLTKKDENEVTYTTDVVDSEDAPDNQDEEEQNPTEEAIAEVANAETEEYGDILFKASTKYPTFALIFGNSTTNVATYGSENKLNGVATDLKRIHALLKGYGNIKNSNNITLTTVAADTFDNSKATSLEYQAAIKRIAVYGKKITGMKVLFLYESGHGGQVFNQNDNDADKLAETRCFYDKAVKDDDTRDFITKTLGGDWVVINVVDRCHSGGLSRIVSEDGLQGTVKSLGVVDNALLYKFKTNPKATEALLKIQSAASEGTYAMDYGKAYGGLFTWKWVLGITAKKGQVSYDDANKYAANLCGTTQVPELQSALNQDHTNWSDKNIFLT